MKDKIKRARLIYNPTSGQEIIKKNIAEVLDVLEDVGYETSAYQTTPAPLSAQKEAERRRTGCGRQGATGRVAELGHKG